MSEEPNAPCPECNGTGWAYFECKVCGAKPQADGEIMHGKGCYQIDEECGGSEYAEPCPECKGVPAS